MASGRPELDAAPIASNRLEFDDECRRHGELLKILLTQVVTLGVVSSNVEVLRGLPCRHSCRELSSQSLLRDELTFASRLPM